MTTVPNATANSNQGRPGRPKRSKARPIVITVVILLALLVGADFGAAAVAEYQVSKRAKAAFNLADDPAVTVRGFPFLTQAIGGEYDHITVDAKGVPIKDILRDVEVHADLRGVRAPLSDLLAGRTDSIEVAEIEGQLRVKEADFNRALQNNALRVRTSDITNVTIAPASEKRVLAGNGADSEIDDKADQEALKQETEDTTAGVRVGATVDFAGQQTDIVVYAMVSLVEAKIQVTPKRIDLGNSLGDNLLAPNLQAQLLPLFSVSLDPGKLPVAITPTAVQVDPGSLSLKGKAANVKLNGAIG
jgi:LmeA-like phospholipid-binding